ncbi:Chromate transport protein ChrA [Paramagnetospirillum magnetotacticum MS-1]|uniref:Chromate transport protein ChrA n=1 Tax=Paramagnetospirillum magnetotacticum MS-1 TaxID=272627 RepID=A0A0C2YGU9_PARME|nr:chromate efflux transporter [Paramagnetospirillum magnetotacticum]KIL98969.1 Chromate transport protein ChrA [Paramagnetospirillum magnetotacticum MS-1]
MSQLPSEAHPSFGEAVRVWVRIGLLSFGGPAAQIATMHRILVDERKWVGEARFLHALNFCMLLPGPEAQQLATYIGWLLHRTRGGIVAGTLFVLPGFLVMMGLAALYAGFHQVPLVDGLFWGIKPAVLAVVIEAILRIGRRALKSAEKVGIAIAAFLFIFLLDLPFPLIVLAAGVWGFLAARAGRAAFLPAEAGEGTKGAADRAVDEGAEHTRPNRGRSVRTAFICLILWLAPVALALFWGQGAFGAVGLFFSKMAVVTFGGAYAVLAYVAQQAVEVHHWLAPPEMLDGLGLAETTPGPLILVNQFVGFLAGFRNPGSLGPWMGGVVGASLTVWVTFVPCFLWILAGAPYVEVLRGYKALSGALAAITAAVVGVIFNLGLWFALHVLFGKVDETRAGPLRLFIPDPASLDPAALALAVAAAIAMLRLHLGMIPTLAAAGLSGIVWKLFLFP